jgi:hypothetical protein
MKVFVLSTLLATIIVNCLIPRPVIGRTEQNQTDIVVTDLQAGAENLHLMLATIAYKYKVPISLEVATDDNLSAGIPIIVHMKSGTLANVLDLIIEQRPSYTWQLSDNVISVFPKREARDAVLESVLDTRIERFSIPKATSQITFRESLNKLPELKRFFADNGIVASNEIFSSYDVKSLGSSFSMNVTELPIRSILNHVIRDSDRKYWFINRYGANRQYLLINF